MKAAVINKFGAPSVFEISEIPVPEADDNQVLIRIYASAVNPMDYKSRQGNHKYILGSNFPIILGYDIAGIVVKIGKNVSRFSVGDKVHGRTDIKYGRAYAQYGVTSESTLSFIPENVSYQQAAAIPLAALTALQALRDKGNIQKGFNVLITGATGGVGHFAVQLTKHFGAQCFAVAGPGHEKFINELAPNVFINYKIENFKKRNERFDIIFDAAGKESYLTCKHLLNPKGIYITSLPRPKLIIHKLLSLFYKGRVKTLIMRSVYQDLDYVDNLIKNGKVNVKIDKEFSLENIDKAHQYAELGHTEGKIVINIDHE